MVILFYLLSDSITKLRPWQFIARFFYFTKYTLMGGKFNMGARIGVVAIIIENRKEAADKVNDVLSDYGELIIGRMGIPRDDNNMGVISLIIEGNSDEVGALTGKLGNLKNVSVKSALTSCEI